MSKFDRREDSPESSSESEEEVGEGTLVPDRKPERISLIKNKDVRKAKFAKAKEAKTRKKKALKKKREKEGVEKQVPHTIESLRVPDETTINITEEKQLETEKDHELDELSTYFSREVEPKVLITYCDNPHKRTRIFGRELTRIIPNSLSLYRNRSGAKKIMQSAIKEGFTDVIIINEDMSKPNGLLLTHLPNGPTAHFRLSNVKITPELRRNYKEIGNCRPEVILNNFTTRLGLTVSRMLASLFHYDPEFKGRRAVTFHNQRDYIFFRHHRYQFRNEKRAALRELGPRFTMKLRSLQHGLFDSKSGEYEWTAEGRRHEIETSRRKFFL
ncbi:probable ribosome production factor 1 [Thrips palmi]|uniref:Probable ribosome production factor 1 n=1 Tax=Thrips palmi TaxID=161013 RepID=A0A6P8YX17_THRPL|nr:probable ribosome production factor 1 [Thrips palmi]